MDNLQTKKALEALEIKEILQKQEDDENKTEQTPNLNKTSDYVANTFDFAKPERVIPLKFHKINMGQQSGNQHKQLLPINRNSKRLLNLNKALILQKLSVAYYCLAKSSVRTRLWGDMFKYLKFALHCYCE